MSALIVLYDGPLAKDTWWPPTYEAMRVASAAQRLGHDRIRIERMGGALVREYATADVLRLAAQRFGSSISLGRIESAIGAVSGVSSALEPHRPIWAVAPPRSAERTEE